MRSSIHVVPASAGIQDVPCLVGRRVEFNETLDSEPASLTQRVALLEITQQDGRVGGSNRRLVLIDDNRTAKDGIERIAQWVSLQNRLPSGADEAHEGCTSGARHNPACILHLSGINRTIEVHKILVHDRSRTRRRCTQRCTKGSDVAAVALRNHLSQTTVVTGSEGTGKPILNVKFRILQKLVADLDNPAGKRVHGRSLLSERRVILRYRSGFTDDSHALGGVIGRRDQDGIARTRGQLANRANKLPKVLHGGVQDRIKSSGNQDVSTSDRTSDCAGTKITLLFSADERAILCADVASTEPFLEGTLLVLDALLGLVIAAEACTR